jgi:riboflavin synthase
VEKGSIAIDGISLTVAAVQAESFQVSIIPHTRSETTLLRKGVGDPVNLENDIVGKYVQRLMRPADPQPKQQESRITLEFLAEHGF